MNYVSAIICIVIGLFILSLSYNSLTDHFGGNSEKLDKLQLLKTEGEIALGIFDSMYLETQVGSSSNYSIDYTFKVEEKEYKGNYSFPHPDSIEAPFTPVTYLKSDPSFFSTDVDGDIMKAQKDSESKFGLYFGLAAALLGLFVTYGGVNRFKQPKTVDYT